MSNVRRHKKVGNVNRKRKGKKGPNDTGLDNVGEYPDIMKASKELLVWQLPRRVDPFPQRFRTVLTCCIRGYVPSGTGATRYFCRLNSPYLPFAGGSWVNAVPAIGTLSDNSFSVFCNANMYQRYRVISSRIEISFVPGNLLDAITATVTPTANNANPTSTEVAMATQFTRFKNCAGATSFNANKISNKMGVHNLVGVRRQAVEDDLSQQYTGTYNSSPNASQWWAINITPDDSVTTTSNVGYSVKLQHEVEFWADHTAEDTALAREQAIITSTDALRLYTKLREQEEKKK